MASIITRYNFSSLSPGRIGPEKVIDARPNKPGIHCYGLILGIILKLFGYASRVNGPTRTYYVNSNSLKYWKERQKTAYHLSPNLDNLDEIIDRIRNAPIIPVQAPAKKKNEIPQIIPHNYEKPIPLKQPVQIFLPSPKPDPLRINFEHIMQQTMGNHLSDVQRQTLMQFFDQAIQTIDPQNTLNQLIDSKINQPNGWGSDKANNHIKRHLLSLMPSHKLQDQNSPVLQNFQSQVHQIAQTPIDAQGNKLVCFYKTGPTEFLGNFAHCPHGVTVWGERFNCSEAAFQWQKYVQIGIKDPLMNQFFTANGEEAFRLNRQLSNKYPNQFPPNWKNGARDTVMWDVLTAKFNQNPFFKKFLDDTKGAYLLEHNQAKRDDYWSDNADGSGKNMLGKYLMAIRDGTPPLLFDDNSNTNRIIYFAQYANNRQLNYPIF